MTLNYGEKAASTLQEQIQCVKVEDSGLYLHRRIAQLVKASWEPSRSERICTLLVEPSLEAKVLAVCGGEKQPYAVTQEAEWVGGFEVLPQGGILIYFSMRTPAEAVVAAVFWP
jgi:hypothetical protein